MNPTVLQLTQAEDLMNCDVVALGLCDTIQDAIALMAEHHVSGLPVVVADDRWHGVVSASDTLAFVGNAREEAEVNFDVAGHFFNAAALGWGRELQPRSASDLDVVVPNHE
ncbi:MAG: CBS domain-containing protein, partial [Planctomycetes bacterium]|nr:CBS domain-containing protein [Planctomycetota bacterium]